MCATKESRASFDFIISCGCDGYIVDRKIGASEVNWVRRECIVAKSGYVLFYIEKHTNAPRGCVGNVVRRRIRLQCHKSPCGRAWRSRRATLQMEAGGTNIAGERERLVLSMPEVPSLAFPQKNSVQNDMWEDVDLADFSGTDIQCLVATGLFRVSFHRKVQSLLSASNTREGIIYV